MSALFKKFVQVLFLKLIPSMLVLHLALHTVIQLLLVLLRFPYRIPLLFTLVCWYFHLIKASLNDYFLNTMVFLEKHLYTASFPSKIDVVKLRRVSMPRKFQKTIIYIMIITMVLGTVLMGVSFF
ncbi:hypothetical protein AB990_12440 [Alkalihalobacillus pseudalcaliphilus]|nr:hypothetical protein AB990_12440 [Alkalihalobacillus pseudalcaliphilus]